MPIFIEIKNRPFKQRASTDNRRDIPESEFPFNDIPLPLARTEARAK
jgi:hypothetical protein